MTFGLSAATLTGLAVAGAGVAGGVIGANGSKSAAKTQAAASDRATDATLEMYHQTRDDNQLARAGGDLYLNKIMHMLGQGPGGADTSTDPNFGKWSRSFTMGDFQADPGYQFRLDQGNKALTTAARVSGGLTSGKYLKDAMAYNQGQASQEYGAARDRWNSDNTSEFNRFSSVAGIGQTAQNNLAAAGQGYAGQIAAGITGSGNARAAGIMGSTNAIAGGLQQGVSAYQNNELINRLSRGRGVNLGTASGADLDAFYQ